MGIYGKGIGIDLGSMRVPLIIAAIVVGIAIAAMAALWIVQLLQTPALQVWFENNAAQLNASEQAFLYAKVTNTTDAVMSSVVVSARAVDPTALSVVPSPLGSNTQQIIGSGETRQFRFLVNPAEGVLPGEYAVKVDMSIAGKQYAEAQAKITLVK